MKSVTVDATGSPRIRGLTREEYVQQIRAKCDELAKVLTSRVYSVTDLAFNEGRMRRAVDDAIMDREMVAEHKRKLNEKKKGAS